MFFKGVAEEGGEVVISLTLVLVVLFGFDRRGALCSARGVGAVRWIRVSLLGTPKLGRAQTVWMCAKVRSLSSSRSSRIWSYAVRRARLLEDLKVARMTDRKTNVVDGERAHVFKSSADIADFAEVGVNSVLGVAIPGNEASDLTGKEDSLHALVLVGESQKSFPYLLSAQKLGRAVLVKNGVDVGKLGPQRHKTVVYGVFKKIPFMFVHLHP
jgi:hypothetical protein